MPSTRVDALPAAGCGQKCCAPSGLAAAAQSTRAGQPPRGNTLTHRRRFRRRSPVLRNATVTPTGYRSSVASLRLAVCAHATCARAFLLCSRCDRGNRYCSRECARAARAIALVTIRRRYEASEQAKADRRARARRYRLAQKKTVTDQGSGVPSTRRNLSEPRLAADRKGAKRDQPKVPKDVSKISGFRECDLSGARCACCGKLSNRVRWGFL